MRVTLRELDDLVIPRTHVESHRRERIVHPQRDLEPQPPVTLQDQAMELLMADPPLGDGHDQLMLDHVQGEAAFAALVQGRHQRQGQHQPPCDENRSVAPEATPGPQAHETGRVDSPGDAERCAAFLAGVVLEAATAPWAGLNRVIYAGSSDDKLNEVENVEHTPDLQKAAEEAQSFATSTEKDLGTRPSTFAARVEAAWADAWEANVVVVPGEGTQLLFPADSTGSKRLPAGVPEISTRFASRALNDSSSLLRRPGRAPSPVDAQGIPQGGAPGDRRANGFNEAGYVLVYVSEDSLSYKTLNDRVIGVTIPGYSDEAFNTVTKLVRGASSGSAPWAARRP